MKKVTWILIAVILGLSSCVPVTPSPTMDPVLQQKIVEATIQAAREEALRDAQRGDDIRFWAFVFLAILSVAAVMSLIYISTNLLMRYEYHRAEINRLNTVHSRNEIVLQGKNIIDPQLLTQPITDMTNPPEIPLPEQMKIKQGQQLVQIAANTQGHKSEVIEQLTNNSDRPWRVHAPEAIPSHVPSDVLPLLDAEWKETKE